MSRQSIDGTAHPVPIPVVLADRAGSVRVVNDEAAELIGLSDGSPGAGGLALGQVLPGLALPEDAGLTVIEELELVRVDGETVPVRVRVRCGGVDAGVVIVIEDRTAEVDLAWKAETNRWILNEVGQIAGIGIFDWDLEADSAAWSDEMFRVFGHEPGEFPPSSERFLSFVHPEDRELARARIVRILNGTAPFEYSGRAIRADGSVFRIEARGKVVRDGSERVKRLYGVVADATLTRSAELDRARLDALIRSAFDGIVITDMYGEIQFFNAAAESIYGRSREQFVGRTAAEVLPSEEAAEAALIARQMSAGESDDLILETNRTRPDGTTRRVAIAFAAIRDGKSKLVGLSGTVRDLSEADGPLLEPGNDQLTGLPVGARFVDMLAESLEGASGALFHVDLDNLRLINQSHGYHVGDWMLRGIAQTLLRECEQKSLIGRVGGDEFAIWCPGVSRSEVEGQAARLLKSVRGYVEPVGNITVTITASIGAAIALREDMVTARELTGRANRALGRAKDGGRDTWVLAGPEGAGTDVGAGSAQAWGERIRRMLAEDSFELYLQPIIDLKSNAVVAYEALLRIREGGETELPGPWLAMAERLGMIKAVDRAVMRSAFDLMEAHPGLVLSVNISGGSIGDGQLLQILREAVRHHRFDPGRLIIELTETTTATENERVRRFAKSLREVGCGLAIDDFGTGYGSYDYLRNVPADFVKIDGQFVQGQTDVDEVVVASLVGLARGLNKKTVAECVESEAVMSRMRRAGIDHAQGFHIGRPAPAARVLEGVG